MSVENKESKIKVIWVSPHHIAGIMLTGATVAYEVLDGIPENSKLVRSVYDGANDRFGIVIWNESFNSIAEGSIIPELFVYCKKRELKENNKIWIPNVN